MKIHDEQGKEVPLGREGVIVAKSSGRCAATGATRS